MKNIITKTLAAISKNKKFMADNIEYVRETNNYTLRLGCIIYMVILMSYTIAVSLLNASSILLYMYLFFDVIHIAIFIAVFTRSTISLDNYRQTLIYCAIFEATFLGFFAVEGVLAYKSIHSLYIPIAIMLVIIVFNHSFIYIFTLTSCYLGLFLIHAYILKPFYVFTLDLRVAIATLLSSVIGYIILANLRLRERTAVNRLEYINKTDPLTDVFRKDAMEEECEIFVRRRSLLSQPKPYAFLIFDIDNFKHFNDTYGHDNGDEVLRIFGMALKRNFWGELVGRFGGDEFLALVSDSENLEDKVKSFMDEIRRTPFSFAEERMSCSIGVAEVGANEKNTDFRKIFVLADQALYEAKENGKNKCVVFKHNYVQNNFVQHNSVIHK